MPVPAARHLERRAGEPRRAHVLDADDRVGAHQLEARLEQALLGERVADLHGRALASFSSSNSADASRLAPWMPSRPVLRRRRSPGCRRRRPGAEERSAATTPSVKAFTRMLPP